MKNSQKMLVLVAAVSVFLLSFLIGRATALHDSQKEKRLNSIYQGTIPFPSTFIKEAIPDEEASASAKVLDETKAEKKTVSQKEEPTRLLFPCGETVLKEYSQAAVYSETMKDWRAHLGIDYAAERGDEVKAAWNGTVKRVYKDKLFGYSVEIEHSDSITGIYRNLAKNISVKKGDTVSKGQVIAKVGNSAAVESKEPSHLHFEIELDGILINPISYVY